MNIYTCKNFTGHYPVGTAAVVAAWSSEQAAALLNSELVKMGLRGDAEKKHMRLLDTSNKQVRILCDGDY